LRGVGRDGEQQVDGVHDAIDSGLVATPRVHFNQDGSRDHDEPSLTASPIQGGASDRVAVGDRRDATRVTWSVGGARQDGRNPP